jgi:hypothetical protein
MEVSTQFQASTYFIPREITHRNLRIAHFVYPLTCLDAMKKKINSALARYLRQTVQTSNRLCIY